MATSSSQAAQERVAMDRQPPRPRRVQAVSANPPRRVTGTATGVETGTGMEAAAAEPSAEETLRAIRTIRATTTTTTTILALLATVGAAGDRCHRQAAALQSWAQGSRPALNRERCFFSARV